MIGRTTTTTLSAIILLFIILASYPTHACISNADCGSSDNTQAGLCLAGVCQCGVGYTGNAVIDPTLCTFACSPVAVPDGSASLVEPLVDVNAAAGNLVVDVQLQPYLYQSPTTVALLHPTTGTACPLMAAELGLGRWAQTIDNITACDEHLVYQQPFDVAVARNCFEQLPQTSDSSAAGFQVTYNNYQTQVEVDQEGLAPLTQTAVKKQATPFLTSISRIFRRDYTVSVATSFVAQSNTFSTLSANITAPTAPIAVGDDVATGQTQPIAISVLDNDVAGTYSLAPIAIASGPSHGSLSSSNNTGIITYTPSGFYHGTDSFVYTLCDTGAPSPSYCLQFPNVTACTTPATPQCSSATVTVSVTPNGPQAVADSAACAFGSFTTIAVLSNDVAGVAGLVTLSVSSAPSANQGSAAVSTLNSTMILFTAAANFAGVATFEYRICDASVPAPLCSTAMVTVSVTSTALIANADTATVEQNGASIDISVLANDQQGSAALDVISLTITANPAHGIAVVTGAGTIAYTPTPGYYGSDALTYQVCDTLQPIRGCASAGVSISVVPRPPSAHDDSFHTDYLQPLTFDVLLNDTAGAQPLPSIVTYSGASPSNAGTLTQSGGSGGSFTFAPAAAFSGPFSFSYEICDDSQPQPLCSSALATVLVGAPLGPLAVNDTAITLENQALELAVLVNDIQGSSALGVLAVITGPAHGTATIQNGSLILYTPQNLYYGEDSFRYQICDALQLCSSATVQVTVQPVGPVAVGDSASTAFQTPVEINVLANDEAGPGGLTTLTILEAPTTGTATILLQGQSILFTPDASFTGVATFSYRICDSSQPAPLCSSAPVSVGVASLAPIAVPDAATVPENGATIVVNVLSNDLVGSAPLNPGSVSILIAPTIGSAAIDAQTGAISYTPNTGYYGSDSLTYQVCDANATAPLCSSAAVDIQVTPVGPLAQPDSASTAYRQAVTINALANDVAGAQPLIASSVTFSGAPADVVYNGGSGGSFTYTPSSTFSGVYEWTYTVCDDSNPTPLCSSATITVQVVAPSGPDAVNDTATTLEDQSVTVPVLDNDLAGSSALSVASVAVTGAPAHGTTQVSTATGEIVYTPSLHYYGVDKFEYRICDVNELCASAFVSITINGNGPQAVADSVQTAQNAPLQINVLANDAIGVANVGSLTVSGANVSVLSDDQILFTPETNFVGTATFQYTVCDNSVPLPLCSSAQVSVVVSGTSCVANNDAFAVPESSTNNLLNPLTNDVAGSVAINPASLTIVGGPSHGSATVNAADGTITYTPTAGYYGQDSISYHICDFSTPTPLCSTTAVMSITINAVGPNAVDDSTSTPYSTPVTTNVLTNDVAGAQPLQTPITIVQGPSSGSAGVDASSSITYSPAPGFTGSVSIVYQVCDNSTPAPLCSTATLTVVVHGIGPEVTAILFRLVKVEYDVIGQRITATVQTRTPSSAKVANVQLNVGESSGLSPLAFGPTTGVACASTSPAGSCDQFHLISFSIIPCQVESARMWMFADFRCADGSPASQCGYINFKSTYSLPNMVLTYDACPQVRVFGVDTAKSSLRLHADAARSQLASSGVPQGSTLYGRCSVFPSLGASFQLVTLTSLAVVHQTPNGDINLGNQLSAPFLSMVSPLSSTDPNNPQWLFDLLVDETFFSVSETYYLEATMSLTFANTGALSKRVVVIPLGTLLRSSRAVRSKPGLAGVQSNLFGALPRGVSGLSIAGSGGGGSGGGGTTTSTPSESGSSASGSSSSSGFPVIAAAAAGIAIAIILGIIIIVVIVVRRRRTRQDESSPSSSNLPSSDDLNDF